MCAEGRPDKTDFGVRIFKGEVVDAYLQRDGRQRGYTIATWRGRHVAEPTELSVDEAARYWLEVLEVGRAIESVLGAVKMNYEVLGNSLPHLHTHVMPRYSDDPRPGWPFPHPEHPPPPHPEDEFRRDVDALRSALAGAQGQPAKEGLAKQSLCRSTKPS
jgi:diadenosine tetraphosphate (Ap4A) HIT family hydrolase